MRWLRSLPFFVLLLGIGAASMMVMSAIVSRSSTASPNISVAMKPAGCGGSSPAGTITRLSDTEVAVVAARVSTSGSRATLVRPGD